MSPSNPARVADMYVFVVRALVVETRESQPGFLLTTPFSINLNLCAEPQLYGRLLRATLQRQEERLAAVERF